MSWQATAWAKKVKTCPNGEKITRSEKTLLMMLSECHNPHSKIVEASTAELAEDCLMSKRSVLYLLQSLQRKACISVISGKETGQQNRYLLLGEGLQPLHRGGMQPLHTPGMQPLHTGCAIAIAQGGMQSDASPSPHTPLPLDNTVSEEGVEVRSRPRLPRPGGTPSFEDDAWKEDSDLRDFLRTQKFVDLPVDIFADHRWWENASHGCRGITVSFLSRVLAALGNDFKKRPQSRPMTKPGWLQKMTNFLRIEREIVTREERKREAYGRPARA